MGEEEVCQRVGPGQGLEGLAGAERAQSASSDGEDIRSSDT